MPDGATKDTNNGAGAHADGSSAPKADSSGSVSDDNAETTPNSATEDTNRGPGEGDKEPNADFAKDVEQAVPVEAGSGDSGVAVEIAHGGLAEKDSSNEIHGDSTEETNTIVETQTETRSKNTGAYVDPENTDIASREGADIPGGGHTQEAVAGGREQESSIGTDERASDGTEVHTAESEQVSVGSTEAKHPDAIGTVPAEVGTAAITDSVGTVGDIDQSAPGMVDVGNETVVAQSTGVAAGEASPDTEDISIAVEGGTAIRAEESSDASRDVQASFSVDNSGASDVGGTQVNAEVDSKQAQGLDTIVAADGAQAQPDLVSPDARKSNTNVMESHSAETGVAAEHNSLEAPARSERLAAPEATGSPDNKEMEHTSVAEEGTAAVSVGESSKSDNEIAASAPVAAEQNPKAVVDFEAASSETDGDVFAPKGEPSSAASMQEGSEAGEESAPAVHEENSKAVVEDSAAAGSEAGGDSVAPKEESSSAASAEASSEAANDMTASVPAIAKADSSAVTEDFATAGAGAGGDIAAPDQVSSSAASAQESSEADNDITASTPGLARADSVAVSEDFATAGSGAGVDIAVPKEESTSDTNVAADGTNPDADSTNANASEKPETNSKAGPPVAAVTEQSSGVVPTDSDNSNAHHDDA